MDKLEHGYAAYQSNFLSRLSYAMRKQIFRLMMDTFKPTENTTLLDVGVMGDAHPQEIEANYVEKLYPWPHKIHGITLEDPTALRKQFPKTTFTRADGCNLPFPDQSFDIVFSSAVVEHVGSKEKQVQFAREACRVGKNVFMATPNRYYPVEVHSRLPLVAYFPLPVFRAILKTLGMTELATEAKLNPLTESQLLHLFDGIADAKIHHMPLFGLTQNIVAIVKRK